jgi:hypothetical protein
MRNQKIMWLAAFATGLLVGRASAQELTITSFDKGYVSWTNINSNLYYTVEYRPNLSETNLAWDGSHHVSQDVKSTNAIITVPVGVFYRVVGSTSPLYSYKDVFQTGQTTSYKTGDDGTYQQGASWPNPRFTVQADTNCVLDNLTGLVWARNANLGGAKTWAAAIDFCEGLNYGGQSDWRLPNRNELNSLIDLRKNDPALPQGHPFALVQSDEYWSSSSFAVDTVNAWTVYVPFGHAYDEHKATLFSVWPVRGGKGVTH